jgi:release factor glutamine methyltransferase
MPPLTTVLDTIEKGTLYLEKKGIDDARRNMQLLVTHQLGCSRVELYMQFDRPMEESELVLLREKLKRRGEGEPLQHLLGSVEFYRREYKSDARALVPRPETEELADIILKHSALQTPLPSVEEIEVLPTEPESAEEIDEEPATEEEEDHRLRILDMGTGSGVLGLTLAAELGGRCAELVLADISPDALSLAQENAELLGIARCQFTETDLFSNLQSEKFHLIVANLPYIAETDRHTLSAEVLRDPDRALFGGLDGLDVVRNFIQQAPSHLHPGGIVALEIGYDQSNKVEALLKEKGFNSITTHKDLNQIHRFPIAISP